MPYKESSDAEVKLNLEVADAPDSDDDNLVPDDLIVCVVAEVQFIWKVGTNGMQIHQ